MCTCTKTYLLLTQLQKVRKGRYQNIAMYLQEILMQKTVKKINVYTVRISVYNLIGKDAIHNSNIE